MPQGGPRSFRPVGLARTHRMALIDCAWPSNADVDAILGGCSSGTVTARVCCCWRGVKAISCTCKARASHDLNRLHGERRVGQPWRSDALRTFRGLIAGAPATRKLTPPRCGGALPGTLARAYRFTRLRRRGILRPYVGGTHRGRKRAGGEWWWG